MPTPARYGKLYGYLGAPMTFTQSQTDVSCHGGSDGTATITVTSGSPPYNYAWNGMRLLLTQP